MTLGYCKPLKVFFHSNNDGLKFLIYPQHSVQANSFPNFVKHYQSTSKLSNIRSPSIFSCF